MLLNLKWISRFTYGVWHKISPFRVLVRIKAHFPFGCKNCRCFIRSFDSRMSDSAPSEPATRVPEPGIPIAMMPAAVIRVNVMVHINLTVVDPVRLSVLG